MRIPILAYQPTRIDGNEYPNNDLKALAADLRQVTDAGFKVRPLRSIVDAWLDNRGHELDGKIIALMTSSGADFDYMDLPHPTAGTQRSVFNVLRDFAVDQPRKQDKLNVTSFVVASPEARSILDTACLAGKGWWNDSWWADAARSGLFHIANHSWDYNHDKLPPSALRSARAGTFETIDSKEAADHQIRAANDFLRKQAPNPGTALFAYPYGDPNNYLVREYFPAYADELGLRAALTMRAGFLEPGTGRWEVPAFLFGRDWRSPDELDAILDAAANRRKWVPIRRASAPDPAVAPSPSPQPSGELRAFGEFIRARVDPIPGWLHDEAALLTAHLAGVQHAAGIAGSTLEIGVYKGKYLSVLYKLSQPGESVVGVDLFLAASDKQKETELVRSNIAAACGEASRLKIVVADSLQLTSTRVMAEAGGGRFRFISIDGGHTAEIVLRDLETAYPALLEGGIIALDDVFNWGTPGVMDGVAQFFIGRKRALAPFAQCYNKLFVTTPDYHARYLREALAFLDEAAWLPTHELTRENRRANRESNFTPALFGYEIVSFVA